QQLAVFDPNEAKVIQTLRLPERNALFAAGAAKLFMYLPEANTLERWDLGRFAKESSATLPAESRGAGALIIGPWSDGPVFVVDSRRQGAEIAVFDPDTLTRVSSRHVPEWRSGTGHTLIRVSDDGRLIGVNAQTRLL